VRISGGLSVEQQRSKLALRVGTVRVVDGDVGAVGLFDEDQFHDFSLKITYNTDMVLLLSSSYKMDTNAQFLFAHLYPMLKFHVVYLK
jgi:hypothetical protein